MAKKRKPREPDPNVPAKRMIDQIAARTEGRPEPQPEPEREKNPAAVALGRLGGLKGGKARAKKLSAAKRKAIAKKAAAKRWGHSSGGRSSA